MDHAAARQNMVDCQILPNHVTNPSVVDGLLSLPREEFVTTDLMGVAYVDEALPLGGGRYLMEPMVAARLLEEAQLQADDVVLCIGCGSGYLSALLAQIVSTVVSVESDKNLAARAGETFTRLDIDNVAVVDGALSDGHAKQGPYDAIVFDGAVGQVPDTIVEQLSEGGRLVAIVIGEDGIGRCRIITRHGGVVSGRDIFDAGAPMLPGFERDTGFNF